MDQSVIAGRRWLPITNSMRLRQEEADRLAEKNAAVETPAPAAVATAPEPVIAPVAPEPQPQAAVIPAESWTLPIETWLPPVDAVPVIETAAAPAPQPVADWIAQAVAAQETVAVPDIAVPEAVIAPEIAAPETSSMPDVSAELAALRDRVAYFESFDSLISDNITRSGELFRSLYEEREKIRGEASRNSEEIAAAATLEAERLLSNERQRNQATLMALMDEASRMQRQIDGLIQKIAEAITESSVRLPEGMA